MIHLILAIISSASVSVLMRLSERHVRNNVSMLALNYLMCALMAGMYAGPANLLAGGDGSGFAASFGAFNGLLYLGSFLLLQWNVRENGVVLPATFMKLGVLVPTLMAIAVFREMPTAAQIIGIAAAIVAIVMIRFERGERRARSGFGLLLLLLGGGATDATSKVYEELGNPAFADRFLLWTFVAALALCVLLCAAKKQRLCGADTFFGLLIGVPNYFSARFLLLSLSSVPAVVAYPTYSVATIVVVTAVGVLLFGERLSRRQVAAMCIILAALVMLNL